MNNFNEYLAHSLDHIKESRVKDAMYYSLLAKGKHVRPNLLFEVLKSYGINEELGLKCATGIEMIHTYSLIHDDLPAMDNDTLRRGVNTNHIEFDEATAILAGDALLSEAFKYAVSSTTDANINQQIVLQFVDLAGANGMILGQARDLAAEELTITNENELIAIDEYKTSKLLILACVCGALIANKPEDIKSWENIGLNLGIAFQIQDDILDITSSTEILGKNVNSDVENAKETYVTLLGIDGAKKRAQELYDLALKEVASLNIHSSSILKYFNNLIVRKF
ncbi:MAG: polyprenyl synthetase family protein [Erysipelotrichaceae bacterium]